MVGCPTRGRKSSGPGLRDTGAALRGSESWNPQGALPDATLQLFRDRRTLGTQRPIAITLIVSGGSFPCVSLVLGQRAWRSPRRPGVRTRRRREDGGRRGRRTPRRPRPARTGRTISQLPSTQFRVATKWGSLPNARPACAVSRFSVISCAARSLQLRASCVPSVHRPRCQAGRFYLVIIKATKAIIAGLDWKSWSLISLLLPSVRGLAGARAELMETRVK